MKKHVIEGIKIGKYTLKAKPIGSGTYGTVYLAKRDDDMFFAAKRLDISVLQKDPKQYDSFVSETKLYHKLSNDHIIKLYDVKRTRTHVYLFLEYCDCETLTSFSKNYYSIFKRHIPSSLLQLLIKQIAEAMAYMSSKNCMHRDLKLDNIMLNLTNKSTVDKQLNTLFKGHNESLLDNLSLAASLPAFNWINEVITQPIYYTDIYTHDETKFNEILKASTIKLIDLGFAKELNDDGRTASFCGSPYQMAPEVWELVFNKKTKENNLQKKEYTKQADLWSLGSCIYQLAFLCYPFRDNSYAKIYSKIKAGLYIIEKNTSNVTVELVDLINGLLRINPEKRYDYKTILNHPFLIKDPKELTPFDWSKHNSNEISLNTNDYVTTYLSEYRMKVKEKELLLEQLQEEEEKKKEEERKREEELEKYINYQFYDENCSLIEYETFIEEWEDWVIVSLKSSNTIKAKQIEENENENAKGKG